jgi:hypothetical protein
VVRRADRVSLFFLACRIELVPFVETVGNDQAALTALPRIAKCGLIPKRFDAGVVGRVLDLSSFAHRGIRPHFISLGMRLPSSERMATSINAVGGMLKSDSKFGAAAAASNFSLILISEKSDDSRTRPHMALNVAFYRVPIKPAGPRLPGATPSEHAFGEARYIRATPSARSLCIYRYAKPLRHFDDAE